MTNFGPADSFLRFIESKMTLKRSSHIFKSMCTFPDIAGGVHYYDLHPTKLGPDGDRFPHPTSLGSFP